MTQETASLPPAPIDPPLAIVLRLAELIARLPDADQGALARARLVASLAAKNGWGMETAAILAWREMDRLTGYGPKPKPSLMARKPRC
jgi:hypothetical protein